ncbi:MAG: glycerol-3-phosphate responsive antiterminator [Fusobacteriaceae bacterium]
MEFKKLLEKTPLIGALKNMDNLETILKSDSKIIFLLCGDILTIEETTRQIREVGKISFIHIELVDGLDSRAEKTIDFLKENSYADGIISTKPNMLKYAKKKNFLTVQRCFLLDSLSFENSKKAIKEVTPDAIEILPGVMPKIIKKLAKELSVPLIAGGLITDIEDVETAIKNGAAGVSSTNLELIKNYYKN